MAYADFDIVMAETRLGVVVHSADLFPNLVAQRVPTWLTEQLKRASTLPFVSEKARSELVISPILLAVRELSADRMSVLSGIRFDVEPARGLVGECDFLMSLSDPLPVVRPPVITLLEAKKQDIDAGLGQCIAQMVAARIFNERHNKTGPVFGCVTTAEIWQFLRLDGSDVKLDPQRRLISNVGELLGAFHAILQQTA